MVRSKGRIPQNSGSSEHEKLCALLEITRSLASQIDLDDLLQLIVKETTKLLSADRTTLYLLDADKNELWSKIAQGAEIKEIRLPVGVGLAGYVALTGETINLADAYDDPRFNREIDRLTGYRTKTMLTAPMRNHVGKIIGVIQVINKQDGLFDEADIALLGSFCSSAAVAVENAQLYADINTMFDSFIHTLAATIDARDPETAGHSHRVAIYAVKLAEWLGLPAEQAKGIRLAALLHDYGKIGVPEAILTKPTRLTPEETGLMQQHVIKTREILSNMYFARNLRNVPIVAAQHHERLDGKGYPDGLREEQISLEGKILAIADVFDAITWQRRYREPMSPAEALSYMCANAKVCFDARIVKALEDIIGSQQDSLPLARREQ
ncbi:MAG: GAF domain-containing protein [Chloroflexi bacterium]|nr:GAF domain-containing protein [Chloroflexota bacterium]MCL5076056.1 GAF domain-containing protein [Chloroflexota bacterium]